MSVKIMGLVWDLDLPRDEKFVLLAYADHASHDGTNIYPSVSTIAEKTGYSERSVQLITRQLEERKLLIPDGRGPKGTNKWCFPVEGVQNLHPEESEGVQNGAHGGAKSMPEGVKPIAPEPSLTVKEPSLKDIKPQPKANTFPELVLFRSVTKRYPNSVNFEDVVQQIQAIKARLQREVIPEDLLRFYKTWCAKGYNPNSLNWLEWAVNGEIPKNGRWQLKGTTATDALEKYAQEIGAI